MFTYFPKLPVELRLQIWKHTLPGPRVIDVNVDYVSPFHPKNHEKDFIQLNCSPPVVLHICQESREVALNMYTLRLNTTSAPSPAPLDPETDNISLRWSFEDVDNFNFFGGAHFLEEGVRGKIRRFAMEIDVWISAMNFARGNDEARYNELLDSLVQFTSLEEFIIVLHQTGCRDNFTGRDSAQVKFVDPELGILVDRANEDVLEDLDELAKDVRKRHHNWRAPKFKLVSMTRGGILCCKAGEEV